MRTAAKLLGKAKRVLIVAGGGAQDASPEVTLLSQHAAGAGARLSARPRRARQPRSVQRDAAARPRAVGRGRRGARASAPACSIRFRNGASTSNLADRPRRCRPGGAGAPAQADGRADRRCRADPAAADRRAAGAQSHAAPRAATRCRSARPRCAQRLAKLAPQLAFLDAIRAELPEDGIFVDEVTQIGFAARLAFPVYKPRTFLSPGYQDNLGWGYATALGAQDARPRRAGAVDHRRRRLHVHRATRWRPRCATAFRWWRSCSTTAPSAMCAASRRSTSATG